MKRINARNALYVVLLIILVTVPIAGLGCQEEEIPHTAIVQGVALSSTLVPNTDFDIYVYVKQQNPTTVLKEMLNTPFDIDVDSLALWGIAAEDSFTLGGGITLTSEAEATAIHGQIPAQSDIWTSLSKDTIYFVIGSGSAALALKSVISNNDFRYYDDQEALYEVSLLPDGAETRLAAVAIAKPSKTLVNLIANNAAPEASGLMEVLLQTANLQVVTAGLYSAQQIDIAEIAKDTELANIVKSDVGILASVKSAWPGFVVNPIVSKALEGAGYAKVKLGELIVYKGYLDAGNGVTVPIIFRVKDNRMFVAISGKESYAEVLITSLNL